MQRNPANLIQLLCEQNSRDGGETLPLDVALKMGSHPMRDHDFNKHINASRGQLHLCRSCPILSVGEEIPEGVREEDCCDLYN